MATRAVLQVGLALEESPASLAAELSEISNDRTSVLRFVERLIARVQHRGHKLAVRVDSSTDGSTEYPLDQQAVTFTCTQASINENDTVVIGNVTLTWKASPSGENQVDIGADDDTCASNLAAAIDAHSKLKGIIDASATDEVVTATYKGDPRIGALIGTSETGSGVAASATSFALDTTEAYAGDTYLFSDGGLR